MVCGATTPTDDAVNLAVTVQVASGASVAPHVVESIIYAPDRPDGTRFFIVYVLVLVYVTVDVVEVPALVVNAKLLGFAVIAAPNPVPLTVVVRFG